MDLQNLFGARSGQSGLPTKLIALTPPGFGRGQTLMVLVDNQVAVFGAPLHCDMPVCPGDANGNGFVDFDEITASLANWSALRP